MTSDILHVSGYPKSGTNWLCAVLSGYFDSPVTPGAPMPGGGGCVVHTHKFFPERAGDFPDAVSFYIVRDIRDVIVSWFHHYRRVPDLAHKAVNIGDFFHNVYINELIPTYGRWDDHVNSWTSRNTPAVKYEEMLANPRLAVERLLTLGGIAIDPARLATSLENAGFDRLKESGLPYIGGAMPPEHFRKGQAGGWKDELRAQDVADIMQMYGETMRAWGYLTDDPSVQHRGILTITKNPDAAALHTEYPFWRADVKIGDTLICGCEREAKLRADRLAMTAPVLKNMMRGAGDTALVTDCGEGFDARALRDWGFRVVTAVDDDPHMIEKAAKIEAIRRDGIEYKNVPVQKIDELYDFVFAFDSLGWIENPIYYFESLHRVTAKALVIGGEAIKSDGRVIDIRYLRRESPAETPSPYTRMSKPSVVNLLREAGFRHVTQIFPFADNSVSLRNFDEIVLLALK